MKRRDPSDYLRDLEIMTELIRARVTKQFKKILSLLCGFRRFDLDQVNDIT